EYSAWCGPPCAVLLVTALPLGEGWGLGPQPPNHPTTQPPNHLPRYTAVADAALFQVALVVFLRGPEFGRGGDLGDDRPAEPARAILALSGGARRRLLLRRVEEDRRAVLVADVGALPVQRRRVVVRPEHLQQVVVGDLPRLVLHLHHLCMARPVRADVA